MQLENLKTQPAEGPVEVDANVRAALDRAWEGLDKIVVYRFENGRQESLATITLDLDDDGAIADNPEELLQAIYQIGCGRSVTLERPIQCRAKFVRPKKKAITAMFRAHAPEIEELHEAQEREQELKALAVDASSGSELAAVGLAMYRTTELMVKATMRAQEMQAQMLADANERLNEMLNRESSLAHHIASTDREAATERALNKAVDQLLRNTEIHYELRSREAFLELEKYKTEQRAKSSGETMKALAEHLPMLGAVALAKLTGTDPGDMIAAVASMGAPPAPPVSKGAPPPPPPAPPASRDAPAAPPAKAGGFSRFMELTKKLRSTLSEGQLKEIEEESSTSARLALESWLFAKDETAALVGMRSTASADGLLGALDAVCNDAQKALIMEALEAVKSGAKGGA